jgi:hypothetical protein
MMGDPIVAISSSCCAIMGFHGHGVDGRGTLLSTGKSRSMTCRREDGQQHEQQYGAKLG